MRTSSTLLAVFVCLLVGSKINAQNFLVQEWMHTTGIPDTIDWSASCTDGSGNIYVTTNTLVDGEKANILTTKYNSSGVVQWEVTYNSAGNDNDYGTAIYVDGSGNVYVAAASFISGHVYDYRTIKYNSSGTSQWNVTYNGPGSSYDVPTDIIVDGSGNVFVTGASYGSGTLSDFCTIKYNSSGTSQWTSRYDYASDQDIGAIIKFSPSGRVLVAGASANSPGSWDFAAIKYNQNSGAQLAANRNSASGSGFDEIYGADVDGSGNIYLTGRAAVVDEGYNMRTVKLDTAVSVVWARNYDKAGFDDESHGVIVDLSGNVYVTGWVTNDDASKSFETIKYNSSGTLQWHEEENATFEGLDAYALKISSQAYGDIAVAGNVDNGASLDFLTIIYNSDGDRLWVEQYDDPDKGDDKVDFVKADDDGIFFVGGKSYTISTSTNRLIKYNWNSYFIPPDDDMQHPSTFTFFENKGQLLNTDEESADEIKYYTNRHTPELYFTDDALSYLWSRIDTTDDIDTIERIDLSFVGSNGDAEINRAVSQGGEYLNYYLPQCPEGITNVKSADRLIVSELYDHVDLEYYFDEIGLKYYLIIKPGWSEQNDPISLLYDGANEVNILGGGELEIVGELGTLTQKVAEAYQIDVDGTIIPLGWDADYVSIDDYEIGFDIGAYDDELPLVIEMKLEGPEGGPDDYENIFWSTIYGFTAAQGIEDVAYDSKDNPIILANSETLEYPTGTGIFNYEDLTGLFNDIFINDFDENRTSIWGAFVGGSLGDFSEELDVNTDNGFIYAVGTTFSDDFYTNDPGGSSYFWGSRTNADNEAFMFRVNSTGNSVDWSTYIEGIIFLFDIDFRNDNTEFSVVGFTDLDEDSWALEDLGGSAFFEDGTVPSANSYLASFTGDYDLNWGTLYWSVGAYSVQYDAANRLSIAGRLYNSQYFETVDDIGETFPAGEDDYGLYFATFASDKSILWATPYGSDGYEIPTGIATQPSTLGVSFVGYVSPNEGETDFTWPAETTFGGGSYYRDDYVDTDPTNDGFIVSFDMNRTVTLSTLFGGENDDKILDIVNDGGKNWFTGITASDNTTTFPYQEYTDYFDDQDNMNDAAAGFGYDLSNAFMSILNGSGDLIYSTYFGGTITSGANDIAYNSDIDHIITTGFAHFESGEDAGFVPIVPYLPFGYFQPVNPEYPSGSFVNFITEWGIFPVITEVNQLNALSDLNVYPNPTEDILNIEIEEQTCYFLYDLSGTLLQYGNLLIGVNAISISKLPAGLYSLSVISKDINSIYKIVKL